MATRRTKGDPPGVGIQPRQPGNLETNQDQQSQAASQQVRTEQSNNLDEAPDEELVLLNIRVPREVRTQIKRDALDQGVSVKAFILRMYTFRNAGLRRLHGH